MFIIADESVDAPIVAALRQERYHVEAIVETRSSTDDDVILGYAVAAKAVLITLDRDFGELIFYRNHQPPLAVIYVRSEGMSMAAMIAEVLGALRVPSLHGQHVTIDRNHRRMRALPSLGETNG